MAAAGSTSLAPAATPALHPPVLAHQAPVPAHLPNPNPIDNLPANQNPAPDAPFINPGAANQNMRMNAQGGAVMEDEEEVERDWLDWILQLQPEPVCAGDGRPCTDVPVSIST